ncbi:hypothetical protein SAMN03159423_4971 [Bradyrhizobium sp. NFR13]|uniref:hypothetical protein n=1 Tax=Bradyrhizobium sp. NFR13 TaxID=1566285 RepID=UPI0008EE3848|nr:hypothetical protein [Bradyrhizobium sp. NFR13]SFM03627.1 hypothetical protein SAMN03159423_4971 [Bradyrhizobium sp. NFR13]
MRKKNTNDVEALSMWATDILLEAHAIAPCPDQHRKFSGKNKELRVKAVEEVLDSLADTCPACE